jgi:hypothetical protein
MLASDLTGCFRRTEISFAKTSHVLSSRHCSGAVFPVLPAKEAAMPWYFYAAYFFGGAFLVNAVPHFTNGVSGHRFPSPFASPPGRGESSAVVNVLWGSLNVVIGYLLVWRVGDFVLRQMRDVVVLGAGGLLMGLMLARTFGRIYGGR